MWLSYLWRKRGKFSQKTHKREQLTVSADQQTQWTVEFKSPNKGNIPKKARLPSESSEPNNLAYRGPGVC